MEHKNQKMAKELAVRIAAAKARLDAKWVKQCQQLLTDAGVPEEVTIVGEVVPTNTAPGRLKWYLLRRKDIQPFETHAYRPYQGPKDLRWDEFESRLLIAGWTKAEAEQEIDAMVNEQESGM